MEWTSWLWGFVDGIAVTLLALPFVVKWFIKKKMKDLVGAFA